MAIHRRRTVERIEPRWELGPPGLYRTNQIAVLWPIKRNRVRVSIIIVCDCYWLSAGTHIRFTRRAAIYTAVVAVLVYNISAAFLISFCFSAKSMASTCAYNNYQIHCKWCHKTRIWFSLHSRRDKRERTSSLAGKFRLSSKLTDNVYIIGVNAFGNTFCTC